MAISTGNSSKGPTFDIGVMLNGVFYALKRAVITPTVTVAEVGTIAS